MSVKELLTKNKYNFNDLREIMEILRGENGCPWDREQTHKSIRNNFIEETYEFIEGVDKDDAEIMKEELGDVLLQVVFHARMSEESGGFNIDDVADGICKKLIYRHPHIFSDTSVKDSEEVLKNWEELKKREKGQKSASDSLKSVSKALPALIRASKIQAKAAKVGFDYGNAADALEKVREETEEVSCELEKSERGEVCNIEEEIGDLLFAVVNVARLAGVNSEQALYNANEKFERRFTKVEEEASKQGKKLENMTLKEMDVIWESVKNVEKVMK